MSGHCMEDILQLLEERILENMGTSEQLKALVEEEVSVRWEQITMLRLEQLEKTVQDLQRNGTPRKRYWEDRVQRLESTVCELESSVRQKLASCLQEVACFADLEAEQAAGITNAATKMRDLSASARVLAAVQAVHAGEKSRSPRSRLPSMTPALAVLLFAFGPVVQACLWIVALAAFVPEWQTTLQGRLGLDGPLSIWFPIGWWHVTHLTGRMHSLATLAAGPGTPRSVRIGNMSRSLTMYFPGVLYCAASSMGCAAALFAVLTIFGTSDCTLDHPFILELLKAVIPSMGELDGGMCWRASWLRLHRAKAGDVVRAQLLKAAGGCLALLAPYVCLGHCAVSNQLTDFGEEDLCFGLGLANLLIGVTITWLCCSSCEELFLRLASVPSNLSARCWCLGFAPAALVAMVLLIKDAGNGDTLCPEVAYFLNGWAVFVSSAVLLASTLGSHCCKRVRDAEPPWQQIFDSCRCLDREIEEAMLVRAQWCSESWPLVTGPWGTVCVSPRTRLPLFVVEYSSGVEVVDLRRSLNPEGARPEGHTDSPKVKPRKWRYAAADIDQTMLQEVMSSHTPSICRRLNVVSRNPDWHAVLIWTLNLAMQNQQGNNDGEQRQLLQETASMPESLSTLSSRSVLVCQVPLQRRRGSQRRSRSADKRFALKLSRTRHFDSAAACVQNKSASSEHTAAATGLEASCVVLGEQELEKIAPALEIEDMPPALEIEDLPSPFRGHLLHPQSAESDGSDPSLSNPNSPCDLRSTAEFMAHGAEIAQSMEYAHVPHTCAPDFGGSGSALVNNLDNDEGLEQCVMAAAQSRSATRSGWQL